MSSLRNLALLPSDDLSHHPSGESSLRAAASADSLRRDGGGSLGISSLDEDSHHSLSSIPTPPVVYGPSIVSIRDVSQVCCGVVGLNTTSSKFCALTPADCNVHKHKSTKATIQPGLFILDPTNRPKKVCFEAPFIPAALVHDELSAEFLAKDCSPKECRDEFALILSQDEGNLSLAGKLAIKSEVGVAASYKTPRKSNLKTNDLSNLDFINQVADFLTKLASISDKEISHVRQNYADDDLASIVATLAANSQELPPYLIDLGNMLHALAGEVEGKRTLIDGIIHQLRSLQSVIGDSTKAQELGIAPTVWGAISSLLGRVMNNESSITAVQTSSSQVQNSVTTLSSDVTNVLTSFRTRLLDLGAKLANLESTGPGGGGLQHLNLASTKPSTTIGVAGNEAVLDKMKDVEKVLDTLTKRVDALEEFNRLRDEQGLQESVRFLGHTFVDQNDVETWFIENGMPVDEIPPFGLFLDPILLYYWVYTRLIGGGTSQSDLAVRKKLGANELEVRALESFNNDVPVIFTGDTKKNALLSGGNDKSHLDAIKTFCDWDTPGSELGLRQKITAKALNIRTSLTKQISTHFRAKPMLFAMGNHMLDTSYSFMEALNQYISDTYNNFKANGVGTDKEIWGLVTFVVRQLFENNFAKMRQEAIGTLNSGSRDSGYLAIWCTMRSVNLAKQLLDVGIKDTPAVSSSYVRFVLNQSNMGKVAALQEQLESNKRKLEDAETNLASVKKVAKEAKKLADSAISKVGALKRNWNGNGGSGDGPT